MDAITGGEIKIVSGFRIRYVTSFRMESEAQKHGYCLFECLPDDILEVQDILAQEKDISVSVIREGEQNEVLFRGIIRRVRLRSCNGVFQIEVLAATASILLDRDKRKRSFQDKAMTYEQAVHKIANAYGSFPVECAGEAATALKEPLIQYGETDWEFLLRLGSRLHLPVYAACTCVQPGLYFGMRQGEQRQWETPPVQMGISRGYYAKGRPNDRTERKDYLFFTASGYQNLQIGDMFFCGQCKGIIFRKRAELQGGILVFTYQAGGSGNWHIPLIRHRQLVGMEFEGTVTATRQEDAKVRLDIDGLGGGAEHDWAWMPVSGNIMYAMPEKGSKVRLDFGTEDALEGMATEDVRRNSGSLPRYQERELMTAAGKKVELHPSRLSLQGDGGRAAILDGTGLSLGSRGPLVMCAHGRVRLNAAEISAVTPLEINMFRSEGGSRQRGGVVMSRGTGSNPPTGGSDSGFTMSFEFNGLSQSGVLCGEDFISYRPFKDSPEEVLEDTEFDWGALVGNVGLGLLAVTAVAGMAAYGASVAFTGGGTAAFAPYVVGGLSAVGGSWFVTNQAEKDYMRGEVSSWTSYVTSGLAGSAKGALAGGAFYMAPYAAPVLLNQTGAIYAGSMLPVSEETILALTEAALRVTTFTNIVIQGSDTAESATGKNPVKAALGENLYHMTGELAELGARATLIAGLHNPDLYVKNKEPAHFDQIPRVWESEREVAANPSKKIHGNSYDINKLKKTQPYTYPENVSSIKETIIQNGPNSVPPIEIRVHNGQALVVDGHHRLEAFRQLGYDRVPIKYLHSSQLGKTLSDGTYYRSIQELLDATGMSN